MGDVLDATPPKRSWGFTRWRAQSRRVIVAGVVVAFLFFTHQTTRDVRLPDGTDIEVLAISRNASFDLRGGAPLTMLIVRYYSDETDAPAMHAEVMRVAPRFFAMAESARLWTLQVEAAKPLLIRSFPVVVIARSVRFNMFGPGDWREAR